MDETTLQVIKSASNLCYMLGLFSSKYDKPIKLYFYKDKVKLPLKALIISAYFLLACAQQLTFIHDSTLLYASYPSLIT